MHLRLANSTGCSTSLTIWTGRDRVASQVCMLGEVSPIATLSPTLMVQVITEYGAIPAGAFTAKYTILKEC